MLLANGFVLSAIIASTAILGGTGCATRQATATTQPAIPTVAGRESPELVKEVHGYILMSEPVGGIAQVKLPEVKQSPLRPPAQAPDKEWWRVHALAGPDRTGRVALIDGDMTNKRHRLTTMRVGDHQTRVLFERRGDPLWDHVISPHLALTSEGGRIAIIAPLQSRQTPGALHHEGPIEVWDVDTGKSQTFDVRALDDKLAWLPDGRRIVFAKLVPRDMLPLTGRDEFMSFCRDWPAIPAVHLLDTTTGQVQFIHPGRSPIVSPDGMRMFVLGESNQIQPDGRGHRWAARWRLVACDGSFSKAVTLHGEGRPVALLKGGLYLTLAEPTEGRPDRFTENNSPLVGPKPMWSLKFARLESPEFVTVVPYFDARMQVSFGEGSP